MLQRADNINVHQVVMACASNLRFMAQLPSGTMKLIVTSPPYNIGKSYERRTELDRYIGEQSQVIRECVRLLHPHGSICWQVGNHVQSGEIFPLDILLYPIFARSRIEAEESDHLAFRAWPALLQAPFRSP